MLYPSNHIIPYQAWLVAIVLGLVALFMSCYSVDQSNKGEDINMGVYSASANLIGISLFIGLFVWYGLLWTQITNRNYIHTYGIVGFIIVVITSGLIGSVSAIRQMNFRQIQQIQISQTS